MMDGSVAFLLLLAIPAQVGSEKSLSGDEFLAKEGERVLASGLVLSGPTSRYSLFTSVTALNTVWRVQDLRYLKHLHSVRRVVIGGSLTSDEGLLEVSQAKQIEVVSVDRAECSGRGLAYLQSLPRLSCLGVWMREDVETDGQRVLVQGLSSVIRQSALTDITFSGSFVDDSVIQVILGSRSLRQVSLCGTKELWDETIAELLAHDGFEMIGLEFPNVTAEDVSRISKEWSVTYIWGQCVVLRSVRDEEQ